MNYIVDAFGVEHEIKIIDWFDGLYMEILVVENDTKLLVKPENIYFKEN